MSPRSTEIDHPVEFQPARERSPVSVSVIIPISERCDDLVEVYRTHAGVLAGMGCAAEFVFVTDSRFEEAVKKLEPLVALGEPIQVVLLPRNYGEATALTVGFEQARGDILVTVPAYHQTIPEGVQRVVAAVRDGCDVAAGRRHPRLDSWVNRLQNHGFHLITRWLTGVRLHDLGCGLRALRKRVVRELPLYGDLHRFLPVLAYQRGFRVTEVPVPQHPRDAGLRVYGLGVYLRRLLDILTLVFLFKFTKKPLRFFGLIGAGLFGSGLAISGVLAVQKILGATALADRPLLILGVLLMVLGVQTGSIGLLGEMIIFTHARKLKDYAIEKVLR